MNYNHHRKLGFIYVGIDCHKTQHTACVINAFNEELDTLTFGNSKEEFEKLIEMVSKYTTEDVKAVYGLEDTQHLGHLLANYLLSRNEIVKHVLSTMTAAGRKKSPIQDKTDYVDSKCIAKATLDELDNLQNVSDNEIYWTLKQLVKMKKSLIEDNIKLKNKLHAQLLHHYPNYKDFFCRIDLVSALDFWETFPSPDLIKDLTPTELKEKFNTKGTFSLSKAELILDIVKTYEYKTLSYQENRNILIQTMVKNIRANCSQIEEMENQIINVYDKLDVKLHTLIGLTKSTSAEIVAQIGNINRFSSSSKLAKYCGIAPISFSSGKHDIKLRNEFGNRQLNGYIYYLACRSIICTTKDRTNPRNPIFMNYYLKKLDEGKTKRQALTCIMRRLINIIYNILKNNVEYEHPESLNTECLEQLTERIEKEQNKNISSDKNV